MVLQAGGMSFPGIGNMATGGAQEVPTKVVCLTEVLYFSWIIFHIHKNISPFST